MYVQRFTNIYIHSRGLYGKTTMCPTTEDCLTSTCTHDRSLCKCRRNEVEQCVLIHTYCWHKHNCFLNKSETVNHVHLWGEKWSNAIKCQKTGWLQSHYTFLYYWNIFNNLHILQPFTFFWNQQILIGGWDHGPLLLSTLAFLGIILKALRFGRLADWSNSPSRNLKRTNESLSINLSHV